MGEKSDFGFFDVNSSHMAIQLPEAKIDGSRIHFEQFGQLYPSRDVEVRPIQQLRVDIEHFRASNSMWNMLTCRIDLPLQYTGEKAQWVNFPVGDVWAAFRNS